MSEKLLKNKVDDKLDIEVVETALRDLMLPGTALLQVSLEELLFNEPMALQRLIVCSINNEPVGEGKDHITDTLVNRHFALRTKTSSFLSKQECRVNPDYQYYILTRLYAFSVLYLNPRGAHFNPHNTQMVNRGIEMLVEYLRGGRASAIAQGLRPGTHMAVPRGIEDAIGKTFEIPGVGRGKVVRLQDLQSGNLQELISQVLGGDYECPVHGKDGCPDEEPGGKKPPKTDLN